MLEKKYRSILFVLIAYCALFIFRCNTQDPWNYEENNPSHNVNNDDNIPPDLKIYPKKKKIYHDDTLGKGEWFYRRIIGIVLKAGQVKMEDNSVDISLRMRLDKRQWETLEEYLTSATPLSEEKYRRSLEYIEESIYKPSLPQKIVMAWSELIHVYLIEYKTEITWTFGALGLSGVVIWIWTHMSHRTAKFLFFIALYLYEVFVSYKEYEQKEVDLFVTALNSCKWYIWSSKCELQKPDPLLFFKHMNPVKIGMRIITNIIAEPIIGLSDTIKTLCKGMTDGLWYPFDAVFSGMLTLLFHIILLFFLIIIVFNFIFNIKFNFSVLYGLINIGFRDKKETPQNHVPTNQEHRIENTNNNAVNMVVIDKLLDFFSKHIDAPKKNEPVQNALQYNQNKVSGNRRSPKKQSGLQKSSSTGRLPDLCSFDINKASSNVRRRNLNGSGDA